MGVGATLFDPSGNVDSEIYFSGNLTFGLRYELSDSLALRSDFRVYGTVLDSDSQIFCVNNNCLVDLNGDIFVQGEALVGLEYKF